MNWADFSELGFASGLEYSDMFFLKFVKFCPNVLKTVFLLLAYSIVNILSGLVLSPKSALHFIISCAVVNAGPFG